MQTYQTLAELTASNQNESGTPLLCRENNGFYLVQNQGYVPLPEDITLANGRVAKFETFIAASNVQSTNGDVQSDLDQIFNQTIASYTTAELAATQPTQTGQRAENKERANAQYELAASGYVALPGDIVAANGRVWELQVDREEIPDKFGSLSEALSRVDCITGLQNTEYVVPAFTLTANKRLKNIHLKYDGPGGEDFITLQLNANADNIEITNCKIDATGADDAIRGGRNGNLTIHKNEIFGCGVVGIQLTGSTGVTENENLSICDNWVHDTGHDCLEVRSSLNGQIEGNVFESWGIVDNNSAAIELQEYHENTSFQNNILINTDGTLFGIESAGATARLINCQISNNIMRGAFTGISGKIDYCSITNNKFYDGEGTWRSGVEIIGEGNKVQANVIYNGSISLASGGSKVPIQNVDMTIVEGNVVRNQENDARCLYIGAESSATGTPTCYNVDVKNNLFDMSQATGTGTRVILAGTYSLQAEIDNINVQNNTIIGPNGVASTEGVRFDSLSGSGSVSVKLNTFKDLGKAVRLNNDNIAAAILRFNDASQNVTAFLSDGSTTTVITNSENDI